MLIRQFTQCSDEVKVKLYRSYCCSIYCCPLIYVYHKCVLKRLPIACNKVFKCLMGVPSDYSASALFVSMNVSNFAILRRKLVYSFSKRVRTSLNSLIITIFNSLYFNSCKLQQEWNDVLFL